MSVVPRLQRRTALGLLAAGLVVVGGCDDGDPTPPAPSPRADPDAALVDRVLAELAAAERLADAAGEPDWAQLHAAHIAALGGEPTTPSGGHAGAAPLRRTEQRLQRHLVDAAMQARSGELARLLASMSAAVAQRLA